MQSQKHKRNFYSAILNLTKTKSYFTFLNTKWMQLIVMVGKLIEVTKYNGGNFNHVMRFSKRNVSNSSNLKLSDITSLTKNSLVKNFQTKLRKPKLFHSPKNHNLTQNLTNTKLFLHLYLIFFLKFLNDLNLFQNIITKPN